MLCLDVSSSDFFVPQSRYTVGADVHSLRSNPYEESLRTLSRIQIRGKLPVGHIHFKFHVFLVQTY